MSRYLKAQVGTHTSKESHDSLPTHSQVLRGSKYQDFEGCVHSIDAMVEEFTEGSALMRSSSATLILASADSSNVPRLTYACEPSTASKV